MIGSKVRHIPTGLEGMVTGTRTKADRTVLLYVQPEDGEPQWLLKSETEIIVIAEITPQGDVVHKQSGE